jgi:hypothetical protein
MSTDVSRGKNMFCPNCGHDNTDTAAHCAACGTALAASNSPPPPPPGPGYGAPPPAYGQHVAAQGPRPPNHMIWAIVATLVATLVTMLTCCCLPLGLAPGIPAIMFANKVNTLFDNGDANGALDASGKAKMWSIVTTVVGGLFLLLLILNIVLQATGVINEDYLEDLRRQLEAGRG